MDGTGCCLKRRDMAQHAIKLWMKVVSHEVTSSCRATYEEVQGNYS